MGTVADMRWRSAGVQAGRAVLYLLTFIHLVLPWTPVNQSDSASVLVGGMMIGIAFLALALWSRRSPIPALSIGAVLFLSVEIVADATGASPWSEGWPVKLVLAAVFVWAFLAVWIPRTKPTQAAPDG
jgi:hypothetical protein